jgi:hypothetical protein
MINDALEKQLQLIDTWGSPKGKNWAEMMHGQIMEEEGAAPKEKEIGTMYIHELMNAEPFYVADNICDIISASLESLPYLPLYEDMLPAQSCWFYFDKPFDILGIDGITPKLQAFCCEKITTVKKALTTNSNVSGDGISITFYETVGQEIYPIANSIWNFGFDYHHFRTFLGEPLKRTVNVQIENMVKVVFAAFSFLRQKLFITASQSVDRAARKRYQKRFDHEAPIIRTVVLRKAEHIKNDSTKHKDIEWSCQWFVRGHFRQQYYRSDKTHRAIWIMPYAKGPSGKPFKKAGVSLFVVNR